MSFIAASVLQIYINPEQNTKKTSKLLFEMYLGLLLIHISVLVQKSLLWMCHDEKQGVVQSRSVKLACLLIGVRITFDLLRV